MKNRVAKTFIFGVCIIFITVAWSDEDEEDYLFKEKDFLLFNSTNFNYNSFKEDSLWLVLFRSTKSTDSSDVFSEFIKTSKALQDLRLANVGVVDVDEESSLLGEHKRDLPVLKVIHGKAGRQWTEKEYEGSLTSEAITSFMQRLVDSHNGNGKGRRLFFDNNPGLSSDKNWTEDVDSMNEFAKRTGNPFPLTPKNFKSEVLHSQRPWLVSFYNPFSAACQELAPHVSMTGVQFQGGIRVGSVDVDSYPDLAINIGINIKQLPIIRLYPTGGIGKGKHMDIPVHKGTSWATLATWMEESMNTRSPKAPRIHQVYNDHEILHHCGSRSFAECRCILNILPKEWDSERAESYLKGLRAVAKQHRRLGLIWMWAWEGDLVTFEKSLNERIYPLNVISSPLGNDMITVNPGLESPEDLFNLMWKALYGGSTFDILEPWKIEISELKKQEKTKKMHEEL